MSKLCDICEFQGGSQPPKEEWSFEEQPGYIRMLQIRDFTQCEKVIPEFIKFNSITKTCEEDDILIARYGASIGKVLTGLKGAYNVAIMKTIPDTSIIRKKYLYYYLKSPYFQNSIINVGSRAAQAGFNKEDLSKLYIECPTLQKQDEIIKAFVKVENIIQFRMKQLIELDQLVKARFVEMFGDPINNSKNLPITDFINIVKLQRGFDLPVQSRDNTGKIPVYGSNGILDYHCEAKVLSGGIITGRSGTIGKVYYENGDYWPLNTTLFSVETNKNNVIYLAYLLEMFDLSRFADGTGVPTLNRNNVHNKKIIDVPIDIQNEFATFVHQVDKSKVVLPITLKNAIIYYIKKQPRTTHQNLL